MGTPALFNKTLSGTPFQYVFPTAHGPQLNPIEDLIMFCSFLLFSAQTTKHGNCSYGSFESSSIPISNGFWQFPFILIVCVFHSSFASAPWLMFISEATGNAQQRSSPS